MNRRAPLTVVQVLPALEAGGVERGTIEVAGALAARGHRAIVISAGGAGVPALSEAGGEHIAWPIGAKSPLTLRWVRRLRRLLREQKVNILHARSRVPAWVAYLAWRGMAAGERPRLVTTVHGLYSVSRYSGVMTKGERVIAVSQTVRDYIERNYPRTDMGKVVVIPRGVDPAAYPHGYRPSAAWREAWDWEHPGLRGRPLVTLPGRLTRLKGHEDFLALMATLRDRGARAAGLIVGGEDPRRRAYAASLRQKAAELGLERDVVFAGHRDDLREVLAISDVVLSLSTQPESFGRTTLEALRLGRPVVGYDHGGVGEVLGALLPVGRVPVGDAGALAARVEAFLDAPPTIPDTPGFSLAAMLDQTVAAYESLAQAAEAPGAAAGTGNTPEPNE